MLPRSFELRQNFPNPFNANTKIEISIPENVVGSRITLKIYDILGHEIITLMNDVMNAGTYSVMWDGKDTFGHQVSSGIYFCHLTNGDYSELMRMVLLR